MKKNQFMPPGEYCRVELLSGGMINQTYKVWKDENTDPFILQELGEMFDQRAVEDYHFLSSRLIKDGWEIPECLQINGRDWYQGPNGRIWRSVAFLPSSDITNIDDLNFVACGALLARLHASLATIDYHPRFALPHFHDTTYHMNLLSEKIEYGFKNKAAEDLACKVLQHFVSLPKIDNHDTQLIHGDPRLANMLFRNDTPFTFIDWDTVMHGSVFIDIGDAVRSLTEEIEDRHITMGNLVVLDYLQGYYDNTTHRTSYSFSTFCQHALHNAARIALELSARFVNDSESDPGYFFWEPSITQTRTEAMLTNAKKQFLIYQSITQLKEELL